MTQTSRAVFLSYAAEDAKAAARVCHALQNAGIEVWFDRSELRGGDAWDATIRQQIKSCALFVPVISTNSRARVEGYFRLEWKLAVDRSHLMATEKPFLVPVVIDDLNQADARVPDRFHEVQWTRLPDGNTPPDFVARMHRLLAAVDDVSDEASTGASTPRTGTGNDPAARPTPASTRRARTKTSWGIVATLLIATLVYVVVHHRLRNTATPEPTPDQPSSPTRASSSPFSFPANPAMAPAKSVAVLPFTDMSEKKDQQYFSDGLAEELIDLLTQIPDLKVTARTSSFSFRDRPVTVAEIGQALKVANVLEGSVRKSGNTVRITAQLVRADNGYHLWSETYERSLKDVFRVQDDIAKVVVDKLKLTLTGGLPNTSTRTDNTQVYNLFLQGNFALKSDTNESTALALKDFQRALDLDPSYAPAWSGLAWARFRRGVNGYDPFLDSIKAAESSLERAIELDPNLATAYAQLGSIRMVQFDWAGSAAVVDKALKLDPGDAQALLVQALRIQVTGDAPEALAAVQAARDRDPLNLLTLRYASRIFYYSNHLADAEALLRKILVDSPNFSAAHYELGRVLLARGEVAAAVTAFEAEANPDWRVLGLPLGYHAAHRTADEATALDALLKHSAGAEFQVAEYYAFAGNADQAFAWIDRAYTADPGIIWLRNDPLFSALANDPRYLNMLRRLNLPPAR